MNRYIAIQTIAIRTINGHRVQIESGKEYHGGFDFRDFNANRSVIFVKVNGCNDEIHISVGEDFMSKFRFIGHVRNVKYMPVQIVKRPRISKK